MEGGKEKGRRQREMVERNGEEGKEEETRVRPNKSIKCLQSCPCQDPGVWRNRQCATINEEADIERLGRRK